MVVNRLMNFVVAWHRFFALCIALLLLWKVFSTSSRWVFPFPFLLCDWHGIADSICDSNVILF